MPLCIMEYALCTSMDELTSDEPLTAPRRTIRRARSVGLPKVEWQWAWIPVGIVVMVVGLWALRPREQADPIGTIPTSAGSDDPAALVAAPTVTATLSAELPALEPIDAVTRVNPPTPVPDVGLVGNPTIVAAETPSGVQETYTVQPGDTLGSIADRFGIPVEDLMRLNGMTDPNWLSVGQVLLLPSQVDLAVPYQRLLPDSEMILGPTYKDFDVAAYIRAADGYLATHSEEVEGQQRTGIEIVEMVGLRYGVGYRPLLAMLEHQSGWVTNKNPTELSYPLGERTPYRAGLFFQLSWAANRMNEGFYNQMTGRNPEVRFADGTRALFHPDTDPGTAAIQNVFAVLGDSTAWASALAETGYYATYLKLFGDPWATVKPLIPADLQQPELTLPWAADETWYFTGGPHGGWGDMSGWAALDFVPPDNTGCQPSSYWATAVSDGTIIRSDYGEVVLDLDGDGFVGTGWTILYMHINSAGRVTTGTPVRTGDPIGRPSCEGGVSDAAHLHIARRYNGVWIDVDGSIPFMMEGWAAEKSQIQYDGYLRRGEARRETCACRDDAINGVRR
jgi:LasA protease